MNNKQFITEIATIYNESNPVRLKVLLEWLDAKDFSETELTHLKNIILENEKFFPLPVTINQYLIRKDTALLGFQQARTLVRNLGDLVINSGEQVYYSFAKRFHILDEKTRKAIIIGWGSIDRFADDKNDDEWKLKRFREAWEDSKDFTLDELQDKIRSIVHQNTKAIESKDEPICGLIEQFKGEL